MVIIVQLLSRACVCITLFVLFLTAYPHFAAAAETADKAPQWYEVVGGILAIPVAILGLAYSYILLRKTRLEGRKIELEIREKELAIEGLTPQQREFTEKIMEPIIEDRLWRYLTLRFALLYVILQLWSIVEKTYNFAIGGTVLGAQKLFEVNINDSPLLIVFYILSVLPNAVEWLIIIAIGWPLFKDINRYLNIDLLGILNPWSKGETLP